MPSDSAASPGTTPILLSRLSRRRDAALAVLLGAVCFWLVLTPTGFEDRRNPNASYSKGRVLEVENLFEASGLVRMGDQRLRVEILEGPFAGETVRASNHLTGKMELDSFYEPGDTVLLKVLAKGERLVSVRTSDHYRLGMEAFLLLLFAVLLVAVAGWTGLKAMLSFLFAGLMIWKVMVPCILAGRDPILVSLGVVAALTGAICFLVGGLNRKGLTAFLGAFLGLLLTCGVALTTAPAYNVVGAVRPFSEALLYSGFQHLELTRIFLAGVFLTSAGAVMDLAMDIAAAQEEIVLKKPGIAARELAISGLRVGRAVIGTMTTTLLLAYSGAMMTSLMFVMAQGFPLEAILNKRHVATDIFNTLVGSFGLVTVAPFTALVGGILFTRNRSGGKP